MTAKEMTRNFQKENKLAVKRQNEENNFHKGKKIL